jgi:subtilisin family serine protease
MKKPMLLISLLALAVFMAPPYPSRAEKPAPKQQTKFKKAKKARPGEYIVVLQQGIADSEIEAIADSLTRSHGGNLMGPVLRHAIKGFGVRMSEGAAKLLADDPRILQVEENAQSEPVEEAESEVYDYQPYGGSEELTAEGAQSGAPWGLDRIDQRNNPYLDGVYRYNRTGQGVDAYIVDSGILLSHNEFGGRAIAGYDWDPNHPTGVDCFGHGTHVAGLVGGRTYGAAKNVRLYAVRIADCSGGSNTYVAVAGVDWAISHYDAQVPRRPAVMNISYAFSDDYYSSLYYAVNNAINHGITVVVAAGNFNYFTGTTSPQNAGAAVNVAATDINDVRAQFGNGYASNFGGLVDLFAPGKTIPSAGISSNFAVVNMSGTSMAAPLTAGVAAMYLEAFPAAPPATVGAAIVNNATAGEVQDADPYGGAYTPNLLLYSFFIPPPPHIIFFSSATYSVNESSAAINITVNRSGLDLPAVTVDYATSDGTALQTTDYNIALGNVSFAAGETSKTIRIFITDDGYVEGNETFNVRLSNPTGGASLGVPNNATVTIVSNDSASSQPIDNTAFFVRQQYVDFLNRDPDPGGFQGWQDVLNNCPPSGQNANGWCDRIEVSAGFFRSPEFHGRGYFIYRFYSTVGRIPIYPEFMFDFSKVSGFLSEQQLEANKVAFVNEFIARGEFQNRYSATFNDPTAYVDALLQTVGLPNHSARGYWINGLSNGSLTRAQVLRGLVESGEVDAKYYNEAFVIMQYFGYLRRTADGAYVNWISVMNQTGGDYRIMINGFMNSSEYRQRFGP